MSEQVPRRKWKTLDNWHQGSFTEVKHGAIDVALGGSLYGAISGTFFGALWGITATQDTGVAIVMGLVGFLAGAIGIGLFGGLVGLAGELICSRLGFDHFLRQRLGGRLDRWAGRLLYGALVGLMGGLAIWLITICLYGNTETIAYQLLQAGLIWSIAGMTGGFIDWLSHWASEKGGLVGGAIVGVLVGLLVGSLGASVSLAVGGPFGLTLAGAIIPPVFGIALGMIIGET